MDERESLQSPQKFCFPFEPYDIQIKFMKALYEAIEERKIAIFESPTGTGKSLSLICGALTWLLDHEKRVKISAESVKQHSNFDFEEKFSGCIEQNKATNSQPTQSIAAFSNSGCDPSWIDEFAQKQIVYAKVEKVKALKNLQEKRERQRKSAQNLLLACQTKREKYLKRKKSEMQDETLLLMEQAKKELEGQHSDEQDGDEELMLETYNSDEDIDIKNEDDDGMPTTKIYFCSRTHSQLSQFIQELRKSPFGKPRDSAEASQISLVALASRKTLCVNDTVRKLSSVHQINEKCLEMQKNVKKKDSSLGCEPKRRKRSISSCSCPYYKNDEGLTLLTNKIVGSIMDMEDLVKEGKKIVACPYYAARHSLPFSQLVVLPYQTLLHESTRLASGIDIRESVIIIDEAHNLVEAINSMYSCQVTAKQVRKALNQLNQYVQKFNKRLKAKNLFYVKQLIYVLRSLLAVFVDKTVDFSDSDIAGKTRCSTILMSLTEFFFKAKLDNINFFKLLKYCNKSKISLKLNGFIEKYEAAGDESLKNKSALATFLTELQNAESEQRSSNREVVNDVMMRSPLMHIESFLKSLTSLTEGCRISITTGQEPTLKFLLLSPAQHFKQILDDCRALVVAGGTMKPTSCLIDQLLPRSDTHTYLSRIVEFSCDHVIDGSTQLLPLVLTCGPSNKQFEFTFEKRKDVTLLLELGRAMLNMANILPGGIVCFFPSYDYENYVFDIWKKEGFIAKLDSKKKVFREPRNAGQVDEVLSEYSKCISRTKSPVGKLNGAILLSVVNGKMSEGINFSDDLGRCVIMVGLPYPNLHSPELKEKLTYLNQNLPRGSDGHSAGQIHYENLCMKAVNQSIGRAIRHRNDYACLLFADIRYARPGVASKLPNWIGKHLKKANHFGEAFSLVRKFFIDKKEKF